jgi:putative salt-induced outer membrane protein
MKKSLFSGLFLALSVIATPALAGDLPPSLQKIISAAAARDTESGHYQYLDVALVLIAESHPEHALDAARQAAELAPQFSPQIASTTQPVDEGPVAAVAFTSAEEQPRAEPAPPAKPDGFFSLRGWTGNVQLGLNLRSGSSTDDDITFGISLKNERRHWTHKFDANYELLKKSNSPTDDKLKVTYQLDRAVSDRLYILARIDYRNEFDGGYQFRLMETLGLGYKLIDQKRLKLNLEAGPSHRMSRLTRAAPTLHEWGGRASINGEWDALSWLDVIFQAGAAIMKDVKTYEAMVGLTTSLTDRLSARLTVEYDHDTSVPAGSPNNDLKTSATLLYGF